MSHLILPAPPTKPMFLAAEAAMLAGVSSLTLTANVVFVYAFKLDTLLIVTAAHWSTGTTATGHTNVGVYMAAGNQVPNGDTGSIANTASTTFTQAFPANLNLPPGQYFAVIASDNGTDTYNGVSLAAAGKSLVTGFRQAANALSGGALPATLGALSNTTKCPAVGLAFTGSLG